MKFIVKLLVILILFTGCSSLDPVMYKSFSLKQENELPLVSFVALPKVELFISAPYFETNNTTILLINDVYLPVEEIPVIDEKDFSIDDISLLEKKSDIETIINTPDIRENEKENDQVSNKSDKEISNDLIVLDEIVKLNGKVDEIVYISLENEGWIYSKNNPDPCIRMRDRKFNDGKTEFEFSFLESGEFLLLFNLHKLTTGEENFLSYRISIDKELKNVQSIDSETPIVIDPDYEIDEITAGNELDLIIKEENVPSLIAHFNQLISEDNNFDNKTLYDAFTVLEKQGGYDKYLVELAESYYRFYPYDNGSAELLYKAARSIELPGLRQDISKALSLYKLVRDYFPITIYCDKSEERIRYLERHFMKIY